MGQADQGEQVQRFFQTGQMGGVPVLVFNSMYVQMRELSREEQGWNCLCSVSSASHGLFHFKVKYFLPSRFVNQRSYDYYK
ncbi:hypothetical protein A6P54_13230 [Bacillus sp. MKU004]|nr:hypothetical protein A6P54_13230 [Bacillus sp. MKU004]